MERLETNAAAPQRLEPRFAELVRELRGRFGSEPGARCFFAPGRVNLMGAHLDYNGGPVMPTAIDRGTFFAVRPRSDRKVRLGSTFESEEVLLDLDRLPAARAGAWYDYPAGVVRALSAGAGRVPGLDVLIGGNLPIGAGLSSSASICVGTAHALSRVWELGLDVRGEVEAALWAEREFVGVRCGIMDPYAVGMTQPGHLLWIDCKDGSVEHVPLDPERVCIAVADSGVRRELAQGAFNERVSECRRAFELLAPRVPGATCLRDVPLDVLDERGGELPDAVAKRARHVLEEVERTFAARTALESGDPAEFGRQMFLAHDSLRSAFEVSVPELDCLVEAASGWEGVFGARLTGAGFGGCTVTLLACDAALGFASHLERAFSASFGRTPTVEFYRADAGPREVPI